MAGMRSGSVSTSSMIVLAEGRAPGFLPERKKEDLPFPFTLKTALGEKEYVFDGLDDGSLLANFKDSGHGQAGGDALINIFLHRRHVVREQNAPLSRGRSEERRVGKECRSRW